MQQMREWCCGTVLLCIILVCCSPSQARYHYHRHHHKNHQHYYSHRHPISQISQPPSSSPSPSPPSSPSPSPSPDDDDRIFDVRAFGAVGDGVSDDTQSIKEAWDAACQVQSATLLLPSAYSFLIQSTIFTGPCQTGFIFQVDGTVMAPDGPESWAKNLSRRQWLVFYRVNELSVQGGGTIDGRGQAWWNLPCKPHKGVNGTTLPGPCDSPIAIRFFMSSNLSVAGIRIKNSPQFNLRFDNCENVNIQSIHITAPPLSPNTDGIHVENTNNVQIYDSLISNGDDCVSIGSGCYDVDIRNLTCGPGGHGISIGSLGKHKSRACVSNITVRDSVIRESDNGVRIKTWQGGTGQVSGVRFDNIHMDNVRNPIIIDQYYGSVYSSSSSSSNNNNSNNNTTSTTSTAVSISGVEYSNIKGTYDIRSPPMHFGCSDWVPCTNITLSEIELLPAEGDVVLDPICWNAYGALYTLTIPPVYCFLDGFPPRSTLVQQNHLLDCSF